MYATLEGGMSIGPCRSIFLEPPDVAGSGQLRLRRHARLHRPRQRDQRPDDAEQLPRDVRGRHLERSATRWPSRAGSMAAAARPTWSVRSPRASSRPSVDGAVASISGRPHVCEILEIGDVNGTAVAAQNMAVRKRGRTTELTHGTVTAIDYTTTVDYGDGLGVGDLHQPDPHRQRRRPRARSSARRATPARSSSTARTTSSGSTSPATRPAPSASPTRSPRCSRRSTCRCARGIKKLEKEFVKEFIPEKWLKHEKLEIKEIEVKERLKDFIKDWKEYAYEKFDWEGSSTEGYDPWERSPWERFPGGGDAAGGPVGRPPVVRRRRSAGGRCRRPPVEARPEPRLRRLSDAAGRPGRQSGRRRRRSTSPSSITSARRCRRRRSSTGARSPG